MKKHSFEFKMKLVKEYERGQGGLRIVAKKYGIHHHNLEKWVANYKRFGEEGLMQSMQQQVYSFEFKLLVVELYLTSELSYQDTALQVGITNPSLIAKWVMDYRNAGPEALKSKKKGLKRTMDKDKIIREIGADGSEDQKELLKQLQEENLRLRIENAFLKEVRRLRLEEEALQRKQRESSTASEENSN